MGRDTPGGQWLGTGIGGTGAPIAPGGAPSPASTIWQRPIRHLPCSGIARKTERCSRLWYLRGLIKVHGGSAGRDILGERPFPIAPREGAAHIVLGGKCCPVITTLPPVFRIWPRNGILIKMEENCQIELPRVPANVSGGVVNAAMRGAPRWRAARLAVVAHLAQASAS